MYELLMFRATPILIAIFLLPTSMLAGEGNERFREAYEHYNRGRWQEAADGFAKYTSGFPEHSNVAIADFFRGESLLQLKKYTEAGGQFEQFLVRHPGHRYERHAEFRVAETAFLSGQFTKASLELRQFQRRYPDSALNNFILAYLGETQLALSMTVPAEATFQHALEHYPQDALATRYRLGLARAYLNQGKDEGEELLQDVLKDLPDDLLDDAKFAQASHYFRKSDFAKCEEACRLIIQQYPNSNLRPQVDHRMGTAIAEQGRHDEAARLLVSTARTFPSHRLTPAIWYRAGATFREGGHLEAAERVFARTTELHPASEWSGRALIDRLNILRDLDKDKAEQVLLDNVRQLRESAEPELRLELARSLLRLDKLAEGESILEVLSKDPQTPAEIVGQAKLMRAENRLAAEDWESAEQILSELTTNPAPGVSPAVVLASLAQAQYGQEKWKSFIDTSQKYLATYEDGAHQANILAKVVIAHIHQADFEASLLAYSKYLGQTTDHESRFEVERVLADTALAHNKYELAKEFYTKLASDGNPPEYVQRGLIGLGWVEAKQKNMEAAKLSFQRAAEQSSTQADKEKVTLSRAQAMELGGNLDGALAIYKEISEGDQDSRSQATALYRSALIHKHLKQWDEAVACFERFTTQFPKHQDLPAALYHLGWTLNDRGDIELADLVFRRLTTEYPNSQFGQRALYRLAQQAMNASEYTTASKLAMNILHSDHQDAELRDHAQYILGKVSIAEQNWTQTIERLSPLVDSQHGLAGQARYLIADATLRLGRTEASAELLDELANWPDLTKETNQGLVPLVKLRRAQSYSHLANWKVVEELCNDLRENHQDFSLLYEADYMLGRVYFGRGEFTKARTAFERVVRSPQGGQTETAAMAQWMIGEALLHQNRTELALQAYERVKSLFPTWKSAALLQAGKCHELNENWQEAVKKYAEILQDYPTTEYAKMASQRLKLARNRVTVSR